MNRLGEFLTPRRLRTYGRLVLGAQLLIWLGILLSGDGLLDGRGQIFGEDFFAFYSAAMEVSTDSTFHSLYNIDEQHQRQLAIAPVGDFIHSFVSPAFVAVLFVPLTKLGYAWGLVCWALAWVSFFVAAIVLMSRELSPQPLRGALLFFYPVFCAFQFGQMTSLYLLVMVSWFVAMRRRNWVWSGLALGVLAFKPQLLVGPVLVLLFSKEWKSLIASSLVCLMPFGLWYQLNPELFIGYFRNTSTIQSILQRVPTWGRQNIVGVFETFGMSSPFLAGLILVLVVIGLGWWWFRRPRPHGSAEWHRGVAIVLTMSLIASPHLFVYDLTLLLLPFAIIAQQGFVIHQRVRISAALVCMASWVGPLLAMFVPVQLFVFILLWCVREVAVLNPST